MRKKNKIKESESNQAQSSIGYTGSVSLEIKSGNRTLKKLDIKNIGTMNLFYGLALVLSQNLGNVNSFLPNYIGVGNGTSVDFNINNNTLVDELSIPRSFRTNLIMTKSNVGYNVTLVGTINVLSETKITEIGLFSQATGPNLLARIQLEGNGVTLQAYNSLIIKWTLSLSNK